MTMYRDSVSMAKTFRNIRNGLSSAVMLRELDRRVSKYAEGYAAEDENFDRSHFLCLCGVKGKED